MAYHFTSCLIIRKQHLSNATWLGIYRINKLTCCLLLYYHYYFPPFQIRALGSEGMIQDMLRYLDIAENLLWQTDAHQTNDLYNIVLHALVKAKEVSRLLNSAVNVRDLFLPSHFHHKKPREHLFNEILSSWKSTVEFIQWLFFLEFQRHKAIEVFRSMRSCGLPANVATYNIMIECCSMLKCFKSACAIISLMLREGFYPQTLTYTALIKVWSWNGFWIHRNTDKFYPTLLLRLTYIIAPSILQFFVFFCTNLTLVNLLLKTLL